MQSIRPGIMFSEIEFPAQVTVMEEDLSGEPLLSKDGVFSRFNCKLVDEACSSFMERLNLEIFKQLAIWALEAVDYFEGMSLEGLLLRRLGHR